MLQTRSVAKPEQELHEILRVTAQNVGDNFAESLRENTFVDILDGVVHIFL